MYFLIFLNISSFHPIFFRFLYFPIPFYFSYFFLFPIYILTCCFIFLRASSYVLLVRTYFLNYFLLIVSYCSPSFSFSCSFLCSSSFFFLFSSLCLFLLSLLVPSYFPSSFLHILLLVFLSMLSFLSSWLFSSLVSFFFLFPALCCTYISHPTSSYLLSYFLTIT